MWLLLVWNESHTGPLWIGLKTPDLEAQGRHQLDHGIDHIKSAVYGMDIPSQCARLADSDPDLESDNLLITNCHIQQ